MSLYVYPPKDERTQLPDSDAYVEGKKQSHTPPETLARDLRCRGGMYVSSHHMHALARDQPHGDHEGASLVQPAVCVLVALRSCHLPTRMPTTHPAC